MTFQKGVRPITEPTAEAILLTEKLGDGKVGDLFTYADLSTFVGRDVRGVAKGALRTARNRALTQHGVVAGCVRNVGIKILSDPETINTATATRKGIRRAARRAMRRIRAVRDVGALSPADKLRLAGETTIAALVSTVTRDQAQKKLMGAINGEMPRQLSIGKTLELFKK